MEELEIAKRERERKVVEIVRNFLRSIQTFCQYFERYKKEGFPPFSDWAKFVDDRGQSILFALKESCHGLFRRSSASVSENEQIFDLTIGSLFHLAMKMREDLYQLEVYGPKYLELSTKKEGYPGQQNLIQQFQKILSRAQASFQEGMEEIDLLFQDILRQFKELLEEYRNNGLLVRFFMEENDLLLQALGKNTLEKIFQTLYGKDEARGYRLAGESYLASAFYAQAVKAFTRALEKSPGDENLQFKIHLSQGLEQFHSFAPLQALRSFEKCLALSKRVEFSETHRAMIRKVCQKIQEEFPGRRKSDQHRDLVKKAKSIERQLGELI